MLKSGDWWLVADDWWLETGEIVPGGGEGQSGIREALEELDER